MTTEKLNSKQLKFIDEYVQSLNATQSAKNAGYSEKSAYSQGHDLLKKPEIRERIELALEEIHQQQKKLLIKAAGSAIVALIETVNKGKGYARVQAAKEILDRSGHKPVDRVQADVINHNPIDELSTDKQREAILDAAESFGAIVRISGSSS